MEDEEAERGAWQRCIPHTRLSRGHAGPDTAPRMEGCRQFGAETVEGEGWFINLPYHPPRTCPLFPLFLSPKQLFKILPCHLFRRSHASFCFSIILAQSISLSLASPRGPFALSPREACWQIPGRAETSASIHPRLSLFLISYLFPFSSASVTFSLSYRGRQAGVSGKQHASLPARGNAARSWCLQPFQNN